LIEEGIHKGLTEAEYDRIDAVRSTTVKMLQTHTPAHIQFALDHPAPDTDAMDLGTAVHIAILEPDSFEDRVVEMTLPGPFRSKVAKAERDAFMAEHSGKIVLKVDSYTAVLGMRDGAHANPLAHRLLTGTGENELTLVWNDTAGIKCKARLDRFTVWDNWATVVDLKTTRVVANHNAIAGEAARFGWAIQQSFYLRGIDHLYGPKTRRFVFLVTEKDPPHLTCVCEIEQESMEWARNRIEQDVKYLAHCMSENTWPGYAADARQIRLPAWTTREL
jgi:exodeoxyribonuclease VIII